jgi:hypothetical protein
MHLQQGESHVCQNAFKVNALTHSMTTVCSGNHTLEYRLIVSTMNSSHSSRMRVLIGLLMLTASG